MTKPTNGVVFNRQTIQRSLVHRIKDVTDSERQQPIQGKKQKKREMKLNDNFYLILQQSGVNFTNVLPAAFACADPKKDNENLTIFCAFGICTCKRFA